MTLGEYAVKKEYQKAIEQIKEVDDIKWLLACAYQNEGYDITAETEEVKDLLLKYSKDNFSAQFLAEMAITIKENISNIETYFITDQDELDDYNMTKGDNPCEEIYNSLWVELNIIAINKADTEDDLEVINEFLETADFTIDKFKSKYM